MLRIYYFVVADFQNHMTILVYQKDCHLRWYLFFTMNALTTITKQYQKEIAYPCKIYPWPIFFLCFGQERVNLTWVRYVNNYFLVDWIINQYHYFNILSMVHRCMYVKSYLIIPKTLPICTVVNAMSKNLQYQMSNQEDKKHEWNLQIAKTF